MTYYIIICATFSVIVSLCTPRKLLVYLKPLQINVFLQLLSSLIRRQCNFWFLIKWFFRMSYLGLSKGEDFSSQYKYVHRCRLKYIEIPTYVAYGLLWISVNLLSTSSELISGEEILSTLQSLHFLTDLVYCSEIIIIYGWPWYMNHRIWYGTYYMVCLIDTQPYPMILFYLISYANYR